MHCDGGAHNCELAGTILHVLFTSKLPHPCKVTGYSCPGTHLLCLQLVIDLAWPISGLHLVLGQVVHPEHQVLIGVLELLVGEADVPEGLLSARHKSGQEC